MGIANDDRALMYARSSDSAGTGTGLYRPARAGAIRSNFFGPILCLSVDGTVRNNAFDRNTWRVEERGAGQPNQLTIEVFGFTPAEGDEIILGAGGITNRLFRGTIVRARKVHGRLNEGRVIYALTCLDWTYQANGILVTKRYTNQTATAIALDLMASAPAGFTTNHVQAGLDTIDEIQFTMVSLPSALQQLADRFGGYGFFDYDKDLWLYTSATAADPEAITSSNRHVRNLQYHRDIEGVRNRILVEGLGASVQATVAAGSTTIPVDDGSAFDTSGGTHHAKLEAQRITYTGVAGTNGAGAGTGYIAPPTAFAGVTSSPAGGSLATGTYGIGMAYVTAEGQTVLGPTTSIAVTGPTGLIDVGTVPVPTDPKITQRRTYITDPGGSTYKLFGNIGLVVTATSFTTTGTTTAPSSNTAGFGTESTAAGATSLAVEELSVFPSAGWAEAPGGQIFSYTGRSASSGPGTLTGIPASGTGSLTAPVRAGTVKVVPHLTGVPASGTGAIAHTLKVGEPINILVISEDAASQASYGLREMPVQDRRLNLTGSAERGAAVLALLKDARISGSCTSTDPKARAGRPLAIEMSEWSLTSISVTIQRVTIRPEPGQPQPMHDVEFASRTIEDLAVQLREIKERAHIR